MAKKITVYHQPGCAPCHRAMEFLTKNGYAYESKDVAVDEALLDRAQRIVAQHLAPTPLVEWTSPAGRVLRGRAGPMSTVSCAARPRDVAHVACGGPAAATSQDPPSGSPTR